MCTQFRLRRERGEAELPQEVQGHASLPRKGRELLAAMRSSSLAQ
jgi:hypothetical protein